MRKKITENINTNKDYMSKELSAKQIENRIFNIRGIQVMLDNDLAEIYQVETRALNQAVKRNSDRFPDDFMFQLTQTEWESLLQQTTVTRLSPENVKLKLSIVSNFIFIIFKSGITNYFIQYIIFTLNPFCNFLLFIQVIEKPSLPSPISGKYFFRT